MVLEIGKNVHFVQLYRISNHRRRSLFTSIHSLNGRDILYIYKPNINLIRKISEILYNIRYCSVKFNLAGLPAGHEKRDEKIQQKQNAAHTWGEFENDQKNYFNFHPP